MTFGDIILSLVWFVLVPATIFGAPIGIWWLAKRARHHPSARQIVLGLSVLGIGGGAWIASIPLLNQPTHPGGLAVIVLLPIGGIIATGFLALLIWGWRWPGNR